MVATKDARLAAVILGAGLYDFEKGYPTGLPGVDANIAAEAGTSKAAFSARSAAQHVEKIKMPVLLLHGSNDDRFDPRLAREFAEKLKAGGTPVQLKVFAGAGHGIPVREQYDEIYPFLSRYLR